MLEILKRFAFFDGFEAPALTDVARTARLLNMPSNRHLARPGRRFGHDAFLVEGEVQLGATHQVVKAPAGFGVPLDGPLIRREDDGLSIRTVSACVVLLVDLRLVVEVAETLPVPVVETADDWIDRLLLSPTLQRFSGAAWQNLLRQGCLRHFVVGEAVIRADAFDDEVFVVRDGSVALIGPTGSRLRTLGVGAYFGEETALVGGPRGYDVVALETGSLISFPGSAVRELAAAFEKTSEPPDFVLDVASFDAATVHRLPKGQPILVRGGSFGERAVIISRLLREGFDVSVA